MKTAEGGIAIMGLVHRFYLLVLTILFVPTASHAGDVPDPCKLLSEGDLKAALGLSHDVVLPASAFAPPVFSGRLSLDGAGNLQVEVPTGCRLVPGSKTLDCTDSVPRRKNTLECDARAGDVELTVAVTSLPQAKVDESEHQSDLDLMAQKRGARIERISHGNANCEDVLMPAADMLGRGANSGNPKPAQMRCYASRSGWQVDIVAIPWVRTFQHAPFTLEQLAQATDQAAQHIPAVPPTPEQNATTQNIGVPAGYMH